MYVSVWMYAWVCESRTTIQPPGLRVLTPIFQLFYCTLNPVNLLLFTLSPSSCSLCLYLSLTHSHAHLFSLRLSYFLSPSPSSSLQYISHSHALSLSCVLRLFSREPSSISLYNYTSTLCIYLCRSRLIQTQTVSAFIRFRQTLRVRLC